MSRLQANAVLQVGTLGSALHLSHLCFPLQSPISPLNSSFLLPDSCRQLCHFLLIYSSAFPLPPPLCFRALRRSRLFLITLGLQSFISYYFLDQMHSLTFYIFPSSSCFPSCAWPPPPTPFKLFLLSVSVCPPSLVRLKINDWPIHSSI